MSYSQESKPKENFLKNNRKFGQKIKALNSCCLLSYRATKIKIPLEFINSKKMSISQNHKIGGVGRDL